MKLEIIFNKILVTTKDHYGILISYCHLLGKGDEFFFFYFSLIFINIFLVLYSHCKWLSDHIETIIHPVFELDHYEDMPMQYTEFFQVVKNDKFSVENF